METSKEAQRQAFVCDYDSGQWSMVELCERYGISRPTGYKWLARFTEAGDTGLEDRSRVPRTCPHRTPEKVERRVLELRERYGWGAKKLLQILATRSPNIDLPATSTVNAILERHRKLLKNRRHRKWTPPGAAPLTTVRSNQVWPVDFKGQFKTLDRKYCYPLTVTDHCSGASRGHSV